MGAYLPKRITIGFWGHSNYFFLEETSEWKVPGCVALPKYIVESTTEDIFFQIARISSIVAPILGVFATILACGFRPRRIFVIPIFLAGIASALILLIFLSEICESSSWAMIEQDQKCELDAGSYIAIGNTGLFALCTVLYCFSVGGKQDEKGEHEKGEEEDESGSEGQSLKDYSA